MINLNLKGKNALVCGSTGGIGKASALALAELGATITLMRVEYPAGNTVCLMSS